MDAVERFARSRAIWVFRLTVIGVALAVADSKDLDRPVRFIAAGVFLAMVAPIMWTAWFGRLEDL